MKKCPYCASEYIIYSKKHKTYFCEDCERGFEQPLEETRPRVFLSYGHDRYEGLVRRIRDELIAHGYDVWIDSCNIPKGWDWRERITDGLMGSNGVLAFLSKHSVRNPGVCLDE